MSDPPLPRRRWIEALDLPAPLLVPSLSSRGFPNIARILDETRAHLDRFALVSALDLSRGIVSEAPWELADVGILDSGGYEAQSVEALAFGWSRERYRALLRTLAPTRPAIIVSYDTFGPLEVQVEAALEDAACAPQALLDLLIKPSRSFDVIVDVDEICRNARLLRGVPIVGVTEDELGESPVARCRALMELRSALDAEAPGTSLHVFGCLRPAAVLAGVLAGAEMFDGLGWLRGDLRLTALEPRTDRPLDAPAATLEQRAWNLALLSRLGRSIQGLWTSGDREDWAGLFPGADRAVAAVEQAGVPLPWRGRGA